jgi:anti-sigma factor RsiW
MTSPCPDKEPMLHALLDAELDAANASALEAHLKTCPGCAQRLAALSALSQRLSDMPPVTAPERLTARIEAMLAAEQKKPLGRARASRPGLLAGWIAAGAMTLVAASLVVTPLAVGPSLPQELADAHARSLLAGHLVDIPTSDRHVVRPWFDGRIGYAPPPAPDLKADGFPLVGGRLDYAEGRPIAALVYRRREHVIDLFVLPAPKGIVLPRLGPAPGGYAMLHWTDKGLSYWAVTDADPTELKGFHEAFEKAAG